MRMRLVEIWVEEKRKESDKSLKAVSVVGGF